MTAITIAIAGKRRYCKTLYLNQSVQLTANSGVEYGIGDCDAEAPNDRNSSKMQCCKTGAQLPKRCLLLTNQNVLIAENAMNIATSTLFFSLRSRQPSRCWKNFATDAEPARLPANLEPYRKRMIF